MNDILYPHQRAAVELLRSGSILCGGVGSGKTLTSLIFYDENYRDRDLYVITTAKKRDSKDWEAEAIYAGTEVKVVESWNNIWKFVDVENAFFIFDEQRAVGYGKWSKSFIKIAKKNSWILLSATPGDTWMDYVPVFIANGFFKNKSEFERQHVIFDRFSKYPKVKGYIGQHILYNYRNRILVNMEYAMEVETIDTDVVCGYNSDYEKMALKDRINPFTNETIDTAGQLCYVLRSIVNKDPSRAKAVINIITISRKAVIFYNFDYELEDLRKALSEANIEFAEWNGHKHEPIPISREWAYLVQYNAGAEGWNCITANTMIFYSQTYSYKMLTQAKGRINRINTPYKYLNYYHLIASGSTIERMIKRALEEKRTFNENEIFS